MSTLGVRLNIGELSHLAKLSLNFKRNNGDADANSEGSDATATHTKTTNVLAGLEEITAMIVNHSHA